MTCIFASSTYNALPTRGAPQQERDIVFLPGRSFYRPQSVFSRDMACISAHLLKQEREGSLSVLDLMSGTGVRGVRYLQHAGATSVWCNDVSPNTHELIVANVSLSLEAISTGVFRGPAPTQLPLLCQPAWDWHLQQDTGQHAQQAHGASSSISLEQGGGEPAVHAAQQPAARVTHEEASRLLQWCSLSGQHFDLIDADSFGGDNAHIRGALSALRPNGMLCLTSTAGPVAGGRDPLSAMSQFGIRLAPVPYANEQGLRMLLGVACREALAQGLTLNPLWSLYSPHGPVYRAMVKVKRASGREDVLRMQQQYGFLLYDAATGESSAVGWDGLGDSLWGRSCAPPPSISGPIWLGPLQHGPHLGQMLSLAEAWEWAGRDDPSAPVLPFTKKGGVRSLGELLQLLQGESEEGLPPWHYYLNDVAKYGRLKLPPPRGQLLDALQARGYSACATHLDSKALRTSATLKQVAAVCRHELGTPSAD